MSDGSPFSARLWLPEFAGILSSASCLVATACILSAYDDKPVFDWRGITLNAVVSVLATAGKASLLFAIAELISQWKWIAFAKGRRPLVDLETIDGASRGPYGSLMVMWKCRAIGFLRLGAIVVLLSLATDPFTQQLVQYKQKVVYTQDNSTTVSRAGRYSRGREYSMGVARLTSSPDYDTNYTNTNADADFSMQSAILYGLDQPTQNVIKQTPFNCTTGNCTWPAFESLAICNRCTDLTDRLEQLVSDGSLYASLEKDNGAATRNTYGGTAFRLPNGLYIDNQNGWIYGGKDVQGPNGPIYGAVMMTTFGTGNASETVSMQDMDTLIWSMTMIRVSADSTNASAAWPDLPRSAMECAISYCVNNLEMEVVNGTLQENVQQASDVTRTSDSWQPVGDHTDVLNATMVESIEFNGYFSIVPRTDLSLRSAATGGRFNVSQAAVDSISSYIRGTLASTLRELNITTRADEGRDLAGRLNGYYMMTENEQYSPSAMQVLFSSGGDDPDGGLRATFAALAASMSNAVRTGADDNFGGAAASARVSGKRGELTTFYRIVWPWIALQCVVVAAGMVFLVVTVLENRREAGREVPVVPVWKSSSLAVMSRGLVVAGILDGALGVQQMRERARAARVSLFEKADADSYPLQPMGADLMEEVELEEEQGGGTPRYSRALSQDGISYRLR